MRIAVAEIKQEGNTFTPVEATLRDFNNEHILEGQDIIDRLDGTSTEIWGFIERALELGFEIIPLFAASALSGGPLSADTFNYIRERLISNLDNDFPIDGIFIALHGAMCANVPGGHDASGLLLRAVREIVGFVIPVMATLDLHANVTPQMASMADALIGYRTWPHVDQAERGQEAAELMDATLRSEIQPVVALSKLRMILQVENGQTSAGPMKKLMDQAREWEKSAKCLSGSVFLVQPWLDLPEMGCSTVIVADKNLDHAQELADRLGQGMWDLRHEFEVPLLPIDKAIDKALDTTGKPILFADVADSTGSGTPGDSTLILQGLLEKKATCKTLLPIVDAEAVKIAHKAGHGATISLPLGAKINSLHSKPVDIDAMVDQIYEEVSFKFQGPVMTGIEVNMGPVAVLKLDNIHILVTERPTWTIDPAMYRAVGLEPAEAKIVVVKSQNTFRAPYRDIAEDIYIIDAPGMSTANIFTLPFEKLPRPMYPFDEDWPGAPWAN
jgi:microcystin degradation protein MlrC